MVCEVHFMEYISSYLSKVLEMHYSSLLLFIFPFSSLLWNSYMPLASHLNLK